MAKAKSASKMSKNVKSKEEKSKKNIKKTPKVVAKIVTKNKENKDKAKDKIKTISGKSLVKSSAQSVAKPIINIKKIVNKSSAENTEQIEDVKKVEDIKKEKPEKKENSPAAVKASKKASVKVAEPVLANWNDVYEKYKDLNVTPYKMSEVYYENTAIDHKILGWGFILSVVNDRLEVLFQSGVKQLISNYKANKQVDLV
jgi:hypothetical protein